MAMDHGSRCRFASGAPTLERRLLVIRLCMFDAIKSKRGFQIYDLYTPGTTLLLEASYSRGPKGTRLLVVKMQFSVGNSSALFNSVR